MFNMLRKFVPSWVIKSVVEERQAYVYEGGEDVAPVPNSLSPKQLKQALVAMTLKDRLADLPEGSPNKLIFNNATLS